MLKSIRETTNFADTPGARKPIRSCTSCGRSAWHVALEYDVAPVLVFYRLHIKRKRIVRT